MSWEEGWLRDGEGRIRVLRPNFESVINKIRKNIFSNLKEKIIPARKKLHELIETFKKKTFPSYFVLLSWNENTIITFSQKSRTSQQP